MKRPMDIVVRGKQQEWCFRISADPAHLEEWRKDGLDVFLVAADVPFWAMELGLAGAWARVQALWQWLRLF